MVSASFIYNVQAHAMTHTFKALIKDKEIIAAEVFNEYNSGVRAFLFHTQQNMFLPVFGSLCILE
jgi:hypothetical protein